VFARLTIALIASMISEIALSDNSVVLGRGYSNTYVERLGCVDDLGMNCWFLWELVVDRTVAGPPVHGRVRALTLQHTDATSTFVKSVELFVLAPMQKSDPTGATHTILSLSPRYPDGMYCVILDPEQLGIPIDRPQIRARPEGSYCFNSVLLRDRR
jgi:hypothetical protein